MQIQVLNISCILKMIHINSWLACYLEVHVFMGNVVDIIQMILHSVFKPSLQNTHLFQGNGTTELNCL